MMIIYERLKKIVISILLIMIFFQIPALARYYENLKMVNAKGIIAEPIVQVELLQDTIVANVDKKNSIKECYFYLKNYLIENNNNNKRINEADFICDIEIKLTNLNFPIKFELYDCTTGEELLDGTNIVTRYKYSQKN